MKPIVLPDHEFSVGTIIEWGGYHRGKEYFPRRLRIDDWSGGVWARLHCTDMATGEAVTLERRLRGMARDGDEMTFHLYFAEVRA